MRARVAVVPPSLNSCNLTAFLIMNRATAVVFIMLAFRLVAFSQKDTLRRERVGISYFSEGGFYPGFAFNYERELLSNEKFQLLLGGKAGAYFHHRNHTGVFLLIQSGQRFRIGKYFHFEHFLGVGYLHSFLNGGDAYYVNASGQIQKAGAVGDPHFMPSVSFGVSYDHRGPRPFSVFVRPMIFWQIPFNEASLVLYGVEAGTLFRLKMKRK